MDPRVSDALKGLAAEQGWDSDTAQKIADIGVQWQQANQAAVAEQVKGWTESSKADSEFGGAQFDANLAKANTVLDTYATPEFVALLRETGLANHPEMIRTFHKLAAVLSEDNLVNGNPPPPAPKDPTKVMYPTMNKTQ